jgi:hypothetical protein
MNDTDMASVGFVPIASPIVVIVKQMPQPIDPKSISGLRPKRSMSRVIIEPQNIKDRKSTPARIRASRGLKSNELTRITGK